MILMMWHHVWWCDTKYEARVRMMMWHIITRRVTSSCWCDTMYDDVTLCMMMWLYDDVTLCMMMWPYEAIWSTLRPMILHPHMTCILLSHMTCILLLSLRLMIQHPPSCAHANLIFWFWIFFQVTYIFALSALPPDALESTLQCASRLLKRVWWCDTMYDDVTLCMMMWHYIWWSDTVYDDVTHSTAPIAFWKGSASHT
jgi:hypothetical protein